jgi:hypothetical protein
LYACTLPYPTEALKSRGSDVYSKSITQKPIIWGRVSI